MERSAGQGASASAMAGIATATTSTLAGGADMLYRLTYANTALAGSAVLYLAYLWSRPEAVGRAATTLASGGALGVVIALAIGALGPGGPHAGLVELTALLSATAVLAYLAMERVYRNRFAGVAVMPTVMAAVLCEMWLIHKGLATGGRPPNGLGVYWAASHRFAFGLGYCAIALTAGLAALALFAREGLAPRRAQAMQAALAVGAPLLVLGAGMGAVWSIVDARAPRGVDSEVSVSWLVATLSLVAWVRVGRTGAARSALLAIAPFVIATTGLLLGRSSLAG
jgi:hypothetical protein